MYACIYVYKYICMCMHLCMYNCTYIDTIIIIASLYMTCEWNIEEASAYF